MNLDVKNVREWDLFPVEQNPLIIAGPCSAENEKQLLETARALKNNGIHVLRAGIWKPRTRPNCFEGVGTQGLEWMRAARRELGIKISTEVANVKHVYESLKANVDLLWIGARTSANPFAMQEIADALKGTDIPVLVKNPVNPDMQLWLGALERLNLAGLKRIGAIHRGFSPYGKYKYRNMPLWQIPIKIKRNYPDMLMICDPSHISGEREYVREISQQAINLGFDGLIIESHICPDVALSDSQQQLTPLALKEMLSRLVIPDRSNTCFQENIEELRAYIDEIDTELLDILARRMKICEKIGDYKKRNHLTILQTGRWNDLLEKIFQQGQANGLEHDFLQQVYQIIHQASIDKQTRVMGN